MPMNSKPLFLWRGSIRQSWERNEGEDLLPEFEPLPTIYQERFDQCPFCSSEFERPYENHYNCPLCGFSWKSDSWDHYGEGSNREGGSLEIATIKQFSLGSSEVSLAELGTHLTMVKSDLFNLPPRRFEELIGDIYRNSGFQVRLTKQSRDGGVDLYLLDSGREQEIVECKRYAQHRRVSVNVVREILGVQLEKEIPRAKIVSTSGFTAPSKELAGKISKGSSAFEVELVDAGELLSNLDCYNEKLPALHMDPRLLKTLDV